MLGSENNLTHEHYSANRNLRALYTDLYNMTNLLRHVSFLHQLS